VQKEDESQECPENSKKENATDLKQAAFPTPLFQLAWTND
jgi:hypothetical protein